MCDYCLKGACSAMKQYKAPDFEVALFEVEDVIADNFNSTPIGGGDPDPGTWY